jgi:hypothetical protein
MKKGAFLLLIFLSAFLSLGFASATTNLTACEWVLASGDYIFNGTINASMNPCFSFLGSNTGIDCNGYSILNLSNGTAFQVGSGGIWNNITIKNCNLEFGNINFTKGNYSRVINNTILNGGNMIGGTYNNTLIENNTLTAETDGNSSLDLDIISLNGGQGNIFKRNLLNGTEGVASGFEFANTRRNYLIDNTIAITGASPSGSAFGFIANPSYQGDMLIGNKFNCTTTSGFEKGCINYVADTPSLSEISIIGNTIYSPISNKTIEIWDAGYNVRDGFFADNIWNLNTTFHFFNNGMLATALFKNMTFLNNTGGSKTYNNIAQLEYYEKWYVRTTIKDKYGVLVPNANVNFSDKGNNLAYSSLTNANGIVNSNITEYFFNFTNGTFYYSNYNITASKYGYSNSTSVNVTTNLLTIEIILGYGENETNNLPTITSLLFSPDVYIKPNSTLLVIVNATDLENDTIGYAFKCSASDSITAFSSNSTKTCYYTLEGNYDFTAYVNDTNTFHNNTYNSYTQTIVVTPETIVKSDVGGSLPIPSDIVNIKEIDRGVLPQIYLGLEGFFGNMIRPAIIIGIAIIGALIIGLIGTLILKIVKIGD